MRATLSLPTLALAAACAKNGAYVPRCNLEVQISPLCADDEYEVDASTGQSLTEETDSWIVKLHPGQSHMEALIAGDVIVSVNGEEGVNLECPTDETVTYMYAECDFASAVAAD